MLIIKKIFVILIFSLFFYQDSFAKKYKIDDIVENKFSISKKFQIDLPKGKWIVAEKDRWYYYGLSNLSYTLVKVKDNKVTEAISIIEWKTAGIMEDLVNNALIEIVFKNKYDGCYGGRSFFTDAANDQQQTSRWG